MVSSFSFASSCRLLGSSSMPPSWSTSFMLSASVASQSTSLCYLLPTLSTGRRLPSATRWRNGAVAAVDACLRHHRLSSALNGRTIRLPDVELRLVFASSKRTPSFVVTSPLEVGYHGEDTDTARSGVSG